MSWSLRAFSTSSWDICRNKTCIHGKFHEHYLVDVIGTVDSDAGHACIFCIRPVSLVHSLGSDMTLYFLLQLRNMRLKITNMLLALSGSSAPHVLFTCKLGVGVGK